MRERDRIVAELAARKTRLRATERRLAEARALLDEISTVGASDDWFARYELFMLSEGVADVPRPIETPWRRAK